MFRAHDPIELLERETRERIAPVNEHGQVHSRPLRTEPRIRDLDLKSLVVMYPLESHTLHRSEEHTSELQSQSNLVCRLLLEKKNSSPTNYFLARVSQHLRERNATRSRHVVD